MKENLRKCMTRMSLISNNIREELKQGILSKFHQVFAENSSNLKIQIKDDHSLVTDIDYFISHFIKEKLKFAQLNFLSEEDLGEVNFPLIVLDPIDGTRELVKGIPECAVSLAIMYDSKGDKGEGWIFNPFTGFEVSSDINPSKNLKTENELLTGMVSRSEFKKGLYHNVHSSMRIIPRGSIAFKLGLLSAGACDFVISFRPKNLWDIAAGTIILKKRGFVLFQDGIQIELDQLSSSAKTLLWCDPDKKDFILSCFISEK